LNQKAEQENIGFMKRMRLGLPWVRLKVAASLDSITALPNGKSKWITGSLARQDGHLWRAQASVLLTGGGTVLADDPELNVRGIEIPNQPLELNQLLLIIFLLFLRRVLFYVRHPTRYPFLPYRFVFCVN
jgi:hypothetical protein